MEWTDWIKDGFLILLLSAITESVMMLFWLLWIHMTQNKRNVHHVYWSLKGIAGAYFMSFLYLFVHRILAAIKNEYDELYAASIIMIRVFAVVLLIWAIGVLYQVARQIGMYRIMWKIKQNRMAVPKKYQMQLQRLCTELRIRKSVALYQSYAVETPFVTGIFRPGIYLPVMELSEEDLEMILYHELIHIKCRDTFWKPFLAWINYIYWFNPLSWILQKENARWTEANCDFYCCQERFQKTKYFTLLLNVADKKNVPFMEYVPMWAEGSRELEWRILCMKKCTMKKMRNMVVAVIAVISVLGGSISAYASTAGVREGYKRIFENTIEKEEETNFPSGDGLEEYEGTVEMFKGTTIIQEPKGEIDLASGQSNIAWSLNNNTTKFTSDFKVQADSRVTVILNIKPTNKNVTVGLMRGEEKTVYVTGKEFISHSFKVSKSGTYKIFVMNKSGTKVTVDGTYVK